MPPLDPGRRKAQAAQRRKAQAAQEAPDDTGGWAYTQVSNLLEDGLTTDGLDWTREHVPPGPPATRATQLFAAFLKRDLLGPALDLAPGDIWKIAPSLTYLFGPAAARAGFAALPVGLGGQAQLLLEAAYELPPADEAEPVPPSRGDAATAAEGFLALGVELPADPFDCLELALGIPGELRALVATAALSQLAPDARGLFAAIGLRTPALGPATRAALARELAQAPAGLAFLASLDHAALGSGLLAYVRRLLMKAGWSPTAAARPLAGDPRAWPALDALASKRDGAGSQMLYLVRERAPGLYIFLGVVENTRRGAVDGSCGFDLDADGLRELRDFLADVGATTRLAPADVAARMTGAIARSRALGHPLPYEVAMGEALLAGVAQAPAPARPGGVAEPQAPTAKRPGGVAAPQAPVASPAGLKRLPAPPAALAESAALLHTHETAGLRLTAADGPAARAYLDQALALARKLEAGKRSRGGKVAFPAAIERELTFRNRMTVAPATLQALLRLAADQAEAVFDAPRRAAWRSGLEAAQAAFARSARPALAELAAAAAGALDPASPVPLAAQPFVLQALALSLFAHSAAAPADATPAPAPTPAGRPPGPASHDFLLFVHPLLEALPPDWPADMVRQVLLGLADVWNAGVAGQPLDGPLVLAKLLVGGLLMRAPRHRRRVQAALDALPACLALGAGGRRDWLADVQVAGAHPSWQIELVFDTVY